MTKTKVTLSINSEVIEKAKRLGVNLSQLAEQTFEILPDPDVNNVAAEYRETLEKMRPNMQKHSFSLWIGSVGKVHDFMSYNIYYEPDGGFYKYTLLGSKMQVASLSELVKTKDFEFLDFDKIISDYLEKLGHAIEKNRVKLQQVKSYQKILEAINEGLK